MTCCVLAALLFAHIIAMVRRWGMYWGLVAVPDGAEFETAYQRLGRWLARPTVRVAVTALVFLEVGAFGGWLTIVHGHHLYQIGDQAIGRLRGQMVVYAEICGSRGARVVRQVFALRQPGSPSSPDNMS